MNNLDLTCFNWIKLVQKSDLNYHAKYLAHYLSTYMNVNQDVAWPSQKRIEAETGMGHATVLKYLKVLADAGWLAVQSGNRVDTNRYWIDVPKDVIEGVGRELTYVASGEKVGRETTSNNNRISINNNNNYTGSNSSRMKRPTVEDITDYCDEKGYTFDPQHFFDYYESQGWKVGRNPMKSWKAACSTWQRREGERDIDQAFRERGGSTRSTPIANDLTDRSWAE